MHAAAERLAEPSFTPIKDERRCYPRVIIDLPVQLSFDSGRFLNAIVHDVSPNSLQIRCPHALAAELIDQETISTAGNQPEVNIRMHLPFHAGALNLSAQCVIAHCTASEDGDMYLGLQFKEFSRIGARILQIFIEDYTKAAAC